MTARRALSVALVVTAAALVAWVRALPLAVPGADAEARAALTYEGADGRTHVYLGDYDSYAWLRHARTALQTGTTCDAVVDGVCRDTFTHAPVGRTDRYHGSLHVAVIVWLQRAIAAVVPDQPLPSTAYLVSLLVAVLGVLPAFAIGRRLGGDLAGWGAAVLIGTNPIVLQRSLGSDNDIWNVVLPLAAVWAASVALTPARGAASAAALRRALAWSLLAALFVALHALAWRGWWLTWAVIAAGTLAHAGVLSVRALRYRGCPGRSPRDLAPALVALVGCALLAPIAATLAGGATPTASLLLDPFRTALAELGLPAAAAPLAASDGDWPTALGTVSELQRPDLARIATTMGGTLFFFAGWLGLLLLVLPRSGWRWWHFVLLIGGNFLYRYLLTAPGLGRTALVVLLGAPLAAAIVLRALGDEEEAESAGPALIVTAWFVAALFLAFNGLRFVMLLVPPFALACGTAAGRLHEWLCAQAAALGGRAARLAAPVLFVTVAALLAEPILRGYDTARRYRPRIHDAWWDTLEALRAETPPETIVTTWWDYGYWVKYVADRRASADGASLQTHIPHWLGRVLLATDERESVGLLRMLDCASDATPEPEGRAGAYGQLRALGRSPAEAHALVRRLAPLDAEGARAALADAGITGSAADAVLAATHCPPPPAYLVLSSEMIRQRAWRYLGGWDPSAGAPTAIGPGFIGNGWRPCRPGDGDERICPYGAPLDRAGTRLDAISYVPGQPATTVLEMHRSSAAGRQVLTGAPAAVLVAGDAEIEEMRFPSPAHPELAVLIDAANDRVLLAPRDLLRSTFTQLMFLDGRYARHFTKTDDRTGYNGERVTAWRITWPAEPAAPAPTAPDR